jgi:hypothetical protein
MDELKGIFKNYKPSQKYNEAFKRAVVKEFEEGTFSKDFIQDKYGLGGNSVLLNWCRKDGKFAYPKNNTIGRPMKDPLQQRIKELEEKLKASELKVKVYEKLIEVTNRELNVDVVKKIEAKLSESWQQKKG